MKDQDKNKNQDYPPQYNNQQGQQGYPQQPQHNNQQGQQGYPQQQQYNNQYPQQGQMGQNQYGNNMQYPNNKHQQHGMNNQYPNQHHGMNNQYPPQQYGMQNQYGNNQQMGMQDQPYNHNNQGQGFQPYGLAQNIIMSYADQIFMKHDSNRSGYIDVKEIYPAVQEIFMTNNLQPPQYNHVLQIMQSFDHDRNGLLDMGEFRTLLLKLNGYA